MAPSFFTQGLGGGDEGKSGLLFPPTDSPLPFAVSQKIGGSAEEGTRMENMLGYEGN